MMVVSACVFVTLKHAAIIIAVDNDDIFVKMYRRRRVGQKVMRVKAS
jgi:hypothetical protein